MNSQRIHKKFGSYGVDVLTANESMRISSLFSVHNDQHVTRTLAVVSFVQPMPKLLRAMHKQIVTGDSIGATYRAHDWMIDKPLVAVDKLPASEDFDFVYKSMQLNSAQELIMHMYRFRVAQANTDDWIPYATIAEIHSPDYLSKQEVYSIAKEVDVTGTFDAEHRPGVGDLGAPSRHVVERHLRAFLNR